MGRHFLGVKANWDFLPNLPFLPILLNVLIVAFSLVVLKGASWRARRARGYCDEERQWATGGIRILKLVNVWVGK